MSEQEPKPFDDIGKANEYVSGAEYFRARNSRTPLDELINGPSESFRKARREAEMRGGIERWPEFTGDLPSNAVLMESDGARLPSSREERFAYAIYRGGDIDHEDSYTLATKGFLFDDIRGAYIPRSTAKKMIEILETYEAEVEGRPVEASYLDHWLREMANKFSPKDLPKEVRKIGKPAEFYDNSFIKRLSTDQRTLLWGSYIGRFIALAESEMGPYPGH